MSKATAPSAGERAADSAAPDGVLSPEEITAAILLNGLKFEGKVLVRVVFEWEDGKLETLLPTPATAGGKDTAKLILAELRKSDEPLTRFQLSKRLGYKSTGGRFGSAVASLLEVESIHEREGLLADDATKFEDGS